MIDFKKNAIYIQWRYYVNIFIQNTEIDYWLDSAKGPNLSKVADEYFEFIKANDIIDYRDMFFIRKYNSFDFNYIHEILGIMLKLKNSTRSLVKLYNGFKNYINALLGMYEGWKGLDFELRHPFYADDYGYTMLREYMNVRNRRSIVIGSQLWIHMTHMCRIGINNICGFPDYFMSDNMPMLSKLMANVGLSNFLDRFSIGIIESETEY